jgi:hypothetical protein
MKLADIKSNPNNPRVIKDDKFRKLVKSIEEFPKMMALRPMVINTDNIVLGGNMRLKALKDLGYKDIPDEWVKRAEDLTEEEQRQFLIKDNVGFGEWEWEMLANEWDIEELSEWGLDIPNWSAGIDENNMTDEDIEDMLNDEFDPIGGASDLMKIVFIFDNELEAETFMSLNHKDQQYKKFGGGSGKIWQVNLSTTYGQK